MDFIYNKLKAIAAAAVAAGFYWIKGKYNLDLSAEVEVTIVGLIMGLVVYFVPNLKPTGAIVKQG
jgi:hypothetical protein